MTQTGTIDLTVTEARRRFLELADRASSENRVVRVTKGGKPLVAIAPWEEHQQLLDILATLDVSTDPDMMAQIRESERQLARGESMSIAELEARLAQDSAAQPPEG